MGRERKELVWSQSNKYTSWFTRCEGKWSSHRRYLSGKKNTVDNLVTEFTVEPRGHNEWAVLWNSDRNEGEMGLVLDNVEETVTRSRNYFDFGKDTGGTVTNLEYLDEDTVVFHSSYPHGG